MSPAVPPLDLNLGVDIFSYIFTFEKIHWICYSNLLSPWSKKHYFLGKMSDFFEINDWSICIKGTKYQPKSQIKKIYAIRKVIQVIVEFFEKIRFLQRFNVKKYDFDRETTALRNHFTCSIAPAMSR